MNTRGMSLTVSAVLLLLLLVILSGCEDGNDGNPPVHVPFKYDGQTGAGGDGSSWQKVFSGPKGQKAKTVRQTHDGGYVIAGSTVSDIGAEDGVCLLKTDAAGNEEWSNTFEGLEYGAALSVGQTADGGYVLGGTIANVRPAIYLIKTDSEGRKEWSKVFGGSSATRDAGWGGDESLQQTSDGGYIIAGFTGNQWGADVYVIKTDSSGNVQWDRTYSNDGISFGISVQAKSDDGYTVIGRTSHSTLGAPEGELRGDWDDITVIEIDSRGIQTDKMTFGADNGDVVSVRRTSDGGHIVIRDTNSEGMGDNDIRVVKVNREGTGEWSKKFGGSDNDYGFSVEQTSDNGYVIAGATVSYGAVMCDAYLIKLTAEGNEEWSRTFGGSYINGVMSVHQTADGGYIVAGDTNSNSSGGQFSIYLIKVDLRGN
ncbi:MAG: hypothetical protein PHV74_09160 [Dehalococcoidia bacterium]|nr:hypothetical protein [Dehalococcoidia bacterium]